MRRDDMTPLPLALTFQGGPLLTLCPSTDKVIRQWRPNRLLKRQRAWLVFEICYIRLASRHLTSRLAVSSVRRFKLASFSTHNFQPSVIRYHIYYIRACKGIINLHTMRTAYLSACIFRIRKESIGYLEIVGRMKSGSYIFNIIHTLRGV